MPGLEQRHGALAAEPQERMEVVRPRLQQRQQARLVIGSNVRQPQGLRGGNAFKEKRKKQPTNPAPTSRTALTSTCCFVSVYTRCSWTSASGR